jgi:hypothetical protein
MGINNNTGAMRNKIADPETIQSGQPMCNGSNRAALLRDRLLMF